MTFDNEQLTHAIDIVRNGGIVIFPTDTAYGIGCRIDRPDIVEKLFVLRKRPPTQAMPVLVSSKIMAIYYYNKPIAVVGQLIDRYWPGALTIVAPCRVDRIYTRIRGDGTTIGLRMPNHPDILRLIEEVGVPILGSSANFHGDPTPYDSDALSPELVKLVDFVIPGKATLGNASTVVDATNSSLYIVRQGACTIDPSFLL